MCQYLQRVQRYIMSLSLLLLLLGTVMSYNDGGSTTETTSSTSPAQRVIRKAREVSPLDTLSNTTTVSTPANTTVMPSDPPFNTSPPTNATSSLPISTTTTTATSNSTSPAGNATTITTTNSTTSTATTSTAPSSAQYVVGLRVKATSTQVLNDTEIQSYIQQVKSYIMALGLRNFSVNLVSIMQK